MKMAIWQLHVKTIKMEMKVCVIDMRQIFIYFVNSVFKSNPEIYD